MSSKRHATWIGLLLVIVFGIWRVYFGSGHHPVYSPRAAVQTKVNIDTSTSTATAVTTTNALVVRAVDGDTIKVVIDGEKDQSTIRLLGINTPESVDPRKPVECFGHEASVYTANHLEGKRVRLDPDPEADDVDKYGRLLRNIVLDDGMDYNAELVRDGYAYAYLSFPLNRLRKTQLRHIEAEAKAANRGLWNPATCNGQK